MRYLKELDSAEKLGRHDLVFDRKRVRGGSERVIRVTSVNTTETLSYMIGNNAGSDIDMLFVFPIVFSITHTEAQSICNISLCDAN